MRAMECPLEGHYLEAENDEELFRVTRKHADEVHPEQEFTDEQLRSMLGHHTTAPTLLALIHPTS